MAYNNNHMAYNQQQYQQREELLAGGHPQPWATKNVDDMNQDELVQTAVQRHKETTAAYGRGLEAVREATQVAAVVVDELKQQGDALNRIQGNYDEMSGQLHKADSDLKKLNRGFLCWLCCACFDKDVDEQKSSSTAGPASNPHNNNTQASKPSTQQPVPAGQQQQQQQQQYSQSYGPDTSGLEQLGYHDQAQQMKEENKVQLQHLDSIGRHLDTLMGAALDIQQEVAKHNDQLAHMNERTDVLNDRLHGTNATTQGILRR